MPAIPAATAAPSSQRLLAVPSSSPSARLPARLRLPTRRRAAPSMSAEARAAPSPVAVPPPAHPTYDLTAVIALALSEDAGDRGDVSCLTTIPTDVKAEATFIAKEDGVIAGISLADMIFNQVDPSLKVEWFENDGNYVSKGLQFGKVHGCAQSVRVCLVACLNPESLSPLIRPVPRQAELRFYHMFGSLYILRHAELRCCLVTCVCLYLLN